MVGEAGSTTAHIWCLCGIPLGPVEVACTFAGFVAARVVGECAIFGLKSWVGLQGFTSGTVVVLGPLGIQVYVGLAGELLKKRTI